MKIRIGGIDMIMETDKRENYKNVNREIQGMPSFWYDEVTVYDAVGNCLEMCLM